MVGTILPVMTGSTFPHSSHATWYKSVQRFLRYTKVATC